MNSVSRRGFIKGAGGLMIGFALADATVVPQLLAQSSMTTAPGPDPSRLDSWLRIRTDGTVHVFTGKHETGTGIITALQQIVAEELDVPFEAVGFTMADTALCPNQGGTTASDGVRVGSQPLRNVAATARLMLLELASKRLGAPIDQLQVKDGIVSIKGDGSRSVSYGALLGGASNRVVQTRKLNEMMRVSPLRYGVNAEGRGKPKDPSTFTLVGKSIPRVDLPPKILGQFTYVTDVRIPGMLHGRVIRPASAAATVMSIDESSAKEIPGFVKTVVEGSFVGVVAETEWAAIRVSRELKVTWDGPDKMFPTEDIFTYMRSATPKATRVGEKKGDAAAALLSAARKLEVTYEWGFQCHSTMDPGCAVADVHPDGVSTIWCGAFKPHQLTMGLAELLRVPEDQVRVISTPDSGGYGRSCFEDTAADAVLLSRAVGKPVRVQWMRSDMTAWGGKSPAVMMGFVAGFDAKGKVTAVQHTSRAFSTNDVNRLPESAGNFLAGQLIGIENTTGFDRFLNAMPEYEFPFLHTSSIAHVMAPFYTHGSPMRTMHIRLPGGISTTFGKESFMDELAEAMGADPVEFRMQHLINERVKAVLSAAAERAGWDRRPSPKRTQSTAEIVTGRGVALAAQTQQDSFNSQSHVATVAEVEVNRRTGVVHVKRLVCAMDCGLIVNPDGLRGTISGSLLFSLSRSLKEEVTFDQNKVTSVDWISYPVARVSDMPESVDIVLLNRPEFPSGGAGEEPTGPTAPAIANAIFDATGVRARRVPFTPARITEALANQPVV